MGLASSIFTELLKVFPLLRQYRVTLALVVCALVAWYGAGWGWSWDIFVSVIVTAFVSYKMLVQPAAVRMDLKSQNTLTV